MLESSIEKLTQNYIKHLIINGINPEKVILYGSYANNTQQKDSDIDMMLISDSFDTDNDKQIGYIWRISKSFDYRIEPYIVNRQRFENDDISPIIQIVKQNGIAINYEVK